MLSDFQSAVQFVSAIYVSISSEKLSEMIFAVKANVDKRVKRKKSEYHKIFFFNEVISSEDEKCISGVIEDICKCGCRRLRRISFFGFILGAVFLFYSSHFDVFQFASASSPCYWVVYALCLLPGLLMFLVYRNILESAGRIWDLSMVYGLKQNWIATDIARRVGNLKKPLIDISTEEMRLIRTADGESIDLYMDFLHREGGEQAFNAAAEFSKEQCHKAHSMICGIYGKYCDNDLMLLLIPIIIKWKFRKDKCVS